ncbi:MAG TPA: hypothetical protein VJJ98_04595 [Sedimentisphaerales bacterium]|nr:hypothetical protein [Sedimentisphaerales bacterium]
MNLGQRSNADAMKTNTVKASLDPVNAMPIEKRIKTKILSRGFLIKSMAAKKLSDKRKPVAILEYENSPTDSP